MRIVARDTGGSRGRESAHSFCLQKSRARPLPTMNGRRCPVGQSGNVLVASLITATMLGTILAGYLSLASSESRLTSRSQAWNLAIGVAEAGIEEALTQINFTNDFTSNGWGVQNGFPTKSRTLGNNSYSVLISNSYAPILISTGSVQTANGGDLISRVVQVKTFRNGLFTKGMVAKGLINLNGNNIKTDSFDSTDPNYSTNGVYDPTRVKSNGDVATDLDLTNSLNVGNANIWGHISTGPGGTASIGPNGSVGDIGWQTGGNHGIQPGWFSDDMNVYFPDVTLPFSGGAFTPTSGRVGGTRYDYVINASGNWELPSIANQSLIVTSNVQAALLVTGDISIAGQNGITIQPGASLKLYMQGASASLGGQGVMNQNGNATNFFYYGLPSNTSLTVTGNGTFTGVIYAPEAALDLRGGGSSAEDFIGSSVSNTVTMNGHFNFHFDEALANLGGNRGYIIKSWNEL